MAIAQGGAPHGTRQDPIQVFGKPDLFLKIDGIEGESFDFKHKGEIDVSGFEIGAGQQGSADVGGGLGTGRVLFRDVVVVANVSKASPALSIP